MPHLVVIVLLVYKSLITGMKLLYIINSNVLHHISNIKKKKFIIRTICNGNFPFQVSSQYFTI